MIEINIIFSDSRDRSLVCGHDLKLHETFWFLKLIIIVSNVHSDQIMSNAGLCNCNVIFKILWIFVSFKPCESITLNVLWYHCLIVIMYLAWRIEQFFHLKLYFTWAAAPVDFCLSRSGCSLNHCNHCLVFYLPHFGMPPPAHTAATAKNPCSCLSCYCIW